MRRCFVVLFLLCASAAHAQMSDRWYQPGEPHTQDGGGVASGGGHYTRTWPGGAVTIPYGASVSSAQILAAARAHGAIARGVETMLGRGYVRRPDLDCVFKNTMVEMSVGLAFEKPGYGILEEQPVLVYSQRAILSGEYELGQLYGGLVGLRITAEGDSIPYVIERPGEEGFVVDGRLTGATVNNRPDELDTYHCIGYDRASGGGGDTFDLDVALNPELWRDWGTAVAVGAASGGAGAALAPSPPDPRMYALRIGGGMIGGALAAHVSFWAKRAAGSVPRPLRATTGAAESTWGALKARYR